VSLVSVIQSDNLLVDDADITVKAETAYQHIDGSAFVVTTVVVPNNVL